MQGFDDILVGAPGTDETNRTCDLLSMNQTFI
jgi:hypothetical protein